MFLPTCINTTNKLQHSNILQQIQSFNKFKAPTFKSPPTNSKLQQIQISSHKFKAPTFKYSLSISNLQHSNRLQIHAPTFKSSPTNSRLPHSNLLQNSKLQQIQSSNIQISSNKLKAPTNSNIPTNSKLQHSNILQQIHSKPLKPGVAVSYYLITLMMSITLQLIFVV